MKFESFGVYLLLFIFGIGFFSYVYWPQHKASKILLRISCIFIFLYTTRLITLYSPGDPVSNIAVGAGIGLFLALFAYFSAKRSSKIRQDGIKKLENMGISFSNIKKKIFPNSANSDG
jgi:hypothetical protein